MADDPPIVRETVVREYVGGATPQGKTPVRQHLRSGVGKLGKAASKAVSPFRKKKTESSIVVDRQMQALADDADALADELSRTSK